MGAVISSGTATVSSGVLAFQPNVMNSGTLEVKSGGIVSSARIHDGGKERVSRGAWDYDAMVCSGGSLYVYNAVVSNPTVYSSSFLSVYAGIASNASIGAGGSMYLSGWLSSGTGIYAYASNTLLYSGGEMYIHQYASAYDTMLRSGVVYISSGGGMIRGTVGGPSAPLGGYATVFVSSGGTAGGLDVEEGGVVRAAFGGLVRSATVHSGGSVTASSGGSLTSTYMSGGIVSLKPGGQATSTTMAPGGMYVSSAAACYATKISGGALYVLSGAVASSTILSSGAIDVYGRVFSGTYSGGNVVISGGSSISDELLGGYMIIKDMVVSGISERGYVERLTVKGSAVAFLSSGCSLNSADIYSGGELDVRSGGTAGRINVLRGGKMYVNAGIHTSGNIYGSETVYSNGVASIVNVLRGGVLSARDNGVLSNCTVSSGGTIYIGSGGSAVDCDVLSSGNICVVKGSATFSKPYLVDVYVSSGSLRIAGGTVWNAELNEGYLTLSSGAYLSSGSVLAGTMNLSSGASTGAVKVDGFGSASSGDYPRLTVHFGAKTSGGSIGGSQASLLVSSGGSAYGMTIANKAKTTVYGFLENSLVSAGGIVNVSSGATADGTEIGYGGILSISKGAYAAATQIKSGGEMTISGGSAYVVNISSGGRMTLSSATVSNCNVKKGGSAIIGSSSYVHGIVSAGGTLCCSGGMVVDRLNVESGGKFTGSINLSGTSSGVLNIYDGILDFDISQIDYLANYALIRDFAKVFVRSETVYTLTVGNTQKQTVYKLADNISEFNKSISVVNTWGTNLGTLTVGGRTRIGDLDYSLKNDHDMLYVTVEAAAPAGSAKSDIDGNGISDVMFVWTGNNYAHGYWMNGTNTWQSANSNHPAEWENLGCHDMTGNGKADSVLFGNVTSEAGIKGAYIGFYTDAIDNPDGSTWQNIGYLTNEDDIQWNNKVGNLTGNEAGVNSIIWYAPELYALGVWKDGKEDWATLSGDFGGDAWKLAGCGDFDGDGKDSVLMSGNNGQYFYAVGLDGTAASLGSTNWSGWEVRAIGDFAGDKKDDIVLFHKATGSMVMCANGNVDSYTSLAQLDANDWFVVGAGDYNGDAKDDLLVRQYSTGMLGYYSAGSTSNWVELGRGVDMNWTVIV